MYGRSMSVSHPMALAATGASLSPFGTLGLIVAALTLIYAGLALFKVVPMPSMGKKR